MKEPSLSNLGVPRNAEREHGALGAAITDAPKYVPCVQIVEVDWFSDDIAELEEAAELCLGCPVLKLCRDYSTKARETEGVWAAVDRGAPGRARKAARDRAKLAG